MDTQGPHIHHGPIIGEIERFDLGKKAISRLYKYIFQISALDRVRTKIALKIIRETYKPLYEKHVKTDERVPKEVREKWGLTKEGEAYALAGLFEGHTQRSRRYGPITEAFQSYIRDLGEEAERKSERAEYTRMLMPVGFSVAEGIRIGGLASHIVARGEYPQDIKTQDTFEAKSVTKINNMLETILPIED